MDLDTKFDRIETKIDTITEKIGSIDTTLASQHEVLKEHIRRTELLEQEVKPIKDHVAAINGVLKFIGLMVPVAALLLSLYKLLLR